MDILLHMPVSKMVLGEGGRQKYHKTVHVVYGYPHRMAVVDTVVQKRIGLVY